MQILHFDWLRYQGTISNSHRVAKFTAFSFIFFPNKSMYFFNLHLLTLLLPFLSDQLGDTKTIRPFALKSHGFRATGLIVNKQKMKMMPGQRSPTTTPNRIVTTGIKHPLSAHSLQSVTRSLHKKQGDIIRCNKDNSSQQITH